MHYCSGVGLYKNGDLKLDELITNHYTLENINQGYEDMLSGKNIRGVLIHDHLPSGRNFSLDPVTSRAPVRRSDMSAILDPTGLTARTRSPV